MRSAAGAGQRRCRGAPGRDHRRAGRAGASERLGEAAAEPAFKGYHGYPATICVSVNEQVVHGIPGSRPLVEGDIVSIDSA